jgi:hypothetical protein
LQQDASLRYQRRRTASVRVVMNPAVRGHSCTN